MRPKKNPLEMSYLKIGFLAKSAKVNVSTVNLFLKNGLLNDLLVGNGRKDNLIFKPKAIDRIKIIQEMQKKEKLSLPEIKIKLELNK